MPTWSTVVRIAAFGLVLSTAVAAGESSASQGDVFDRVSHGTAVSDGATLREMIDCNASETRSNTRTERVFLFAQHVTQPVAALRQHLRQQTLHLPPTIVDALEEQLDIGGQRRIAFTAHQHSTSGAAIQLVRSFGDHQRATRLGGDRQLARLETAQIGDVGAEWPAIARRNGP